MGISLSMSLRCTPQSATLNAATLPVAYFRHDQWGRRSEVLSHPETDPRGVVKIVREAETNRSLTQEIG